MNNQKDKPSYWFNAIMQNREKFSDAPASVQSWFRIMLFRQAKYIVGLPTKKARHKFVDKCPPSCRDELKREVTRLWKLRK